MIWPLGCAHLAVEVFQANHFGFYVALEHENWKVCVNHSVVTAASGEPKHAPRVRCYLLGMVKHIVITQIG
ncbi:hypothetical protein D3C86_2198710 [compost metagenome]